MKKVWTHKKYKNREFVGSYQRTKKDRVFQLKNGKRVISFESWQAAINAKWRSW